MTTPTAIQIRPAIAADYAAACTLVSSVAEPLPPTLGDEATFAEGVAAESIFVACTGAAIVGLLVAQPIAYDGERPYTLWVELICITPALPYLPVATSLYQAFGAWATAAGAQAALTALMTDPNAQQLHQQVGFIHHRDNLLLWKFGSAA